MNNKNNSWHYNSWHRNSWDYNSWYLNIDRPKLRIFGKETDIEIGDITFPDFFYFDINTYCEETWEILVKYEYKEAFQNSYNSLSEEEREKQTKQLKEIPNFDKDIFFEISGIDIDINLDDIKEYTMEQLQEKLWETFKLIK